MQIAAKHPLRHTAHCERISLQIATKALTISGAADFEKPEKVILLSLELGEFFTHEVINGIEPCIGLGTSSPRIDEVAI